VSETVWLAERAYEYEGSSVEGVFATLAAAKAWLEAQWKQDKEDGGHPTEVWERTGTRPDYLQMKWWEYECGSRTMSVTPWDVETEQTPTNANTETP
jgi:hypothetical protein